jgi:hypothetical protein
MKYIELADVIFKINEEKFLPNSCSTYFTDINNIYDHEITIHRVDYDNYRNIGDYVSMNFDYKIYSSDSGYSIEVFQKHPVKNQIFCACQLCVPYDWHKLTLYDYITETERYTDPANYKSLFQCISLYIVGILPYHNAFTLHSVSLQYKNKGICFTASSGVGKTTHTNFWKHKFGAEILNGDTPIIKFIDDKPYIYGSPWCGTSDIFVKKKVPLDVIVTLKRGKENKMRKLSKFEAVSFILGQIRRPMWDIKLTDMCLTYAEMLTNTISVYELECLPNEEAAEVALAGIEELHG